ncbi:P-loop containing nucleoside triphosphate hydrolase protein [Amanita muscaria]
MLESMDMAAEQHVPSFSDIRSKTFENLGKTPCAWQIHVCEAVLHGDRDIISIAGTGMGKTLTFWMPLLFRPQGIQLVVTPLNILGEQNTLILDRLGIEGIFISAATATDLNFRAIASLRYCVIIVNPEELMRPNGGFEKLFRDKMFNQHLISIIVDEAHCISQWGSFRSEYRDIGRIRHLQRKPSPILVTSATMSSAVIDDVKKVLLLRAENLFISQCSTDRTNISIIVRPILNSIRSFRDLAFLLCDWKPGDPPPPKFIIFFDNINTSIQAGLFLCSLLPHVYHQRVKWFNSEMSDRFKRNEAARFASGETWGLMATDSFRMGMDLPDISLVVQWCAPTSISMLWQRFGRCVRDPSLQGTAILFVEKEYIDNLNNMKKKRKRITSSVKTEPRTSLTAKRLRTVPLTERSIGEDDGDSQSDHELPEEHLGEEDGEQEPGGDDDDDDDDDNDHEKGQKTKTGKKKKSKSAKIDPEILDLINAETRGIGCRREPFLKKFDNSKSRSLHLECDPTSPNGCVRCSPAPAMICCDIHEPRLASMYKSAVVKTPRQPCRSRLPTVKVMTNEDQEMQERKDAALRLDLEVWRRDQAKKEFGQGHTRNLGPSLVMGLSTCERIVHCARHMKIKTIEQLERETKWTRTFEFGPEVIKIIAKHYPFNPPPTGPTYVVDHMMPLSNQIMQTSTVINPHPMKRLVTCSACHKQGHIRTSKLCEAKRNKENVAPVHSALPTLLPSALPPPLPSSSTMLSPIFASTLSSTLHGNLSPATLVSLSSHFASISLARQQKSN